MKTTILILALILNFSVVAQQEDNSIFLFGTDSLKLSETDFGLYKKYTVKVIGKDNKEKTKKSFTVYNDEPQEFATKFKAVCSEINSSIPQNADISNEARIAYLRLRSMEINNKLSSSKDNISPVAGLLSINGDVNIQQVDPKLKKQVKALSTAKLETLIEKQSVCFKSYCSGCKNSTVEFKDKTPNNLGYKYIENTKKGGENTIISQKYYNKKKELKRRFIELIADSILGNENLAIYRHDSIVKDYEFKIANDTNKIADIDEELKLLNQQKKELVQLKNNVNENKNKIQQETDSLRRIYPGVRQSLEGLKDLYKNLINNEDSSNNLINSENTFNQKITSKIKYYKDTIKKLNTKIIDLEVKIDNFNNNQPKYENQDQYDLETITGTKKRQELIKRQYADSLHFIQELQKSITGLVYKKLNLIYLKAKYRFSYDKLDSVIEEKDTFIKDKKEKKETLNKKINEYQNNLAFYNNKLQQIKKNMLIQKLSVDTVQIEFNNGSIENIQVIGKLEQSGETLKFSNLRPFGFTSKSDYDRLNMRWLFSDNSNGYVYSLNVGKLIDEYYEKYSVDRRDYSPKNQAITIKRTNKPLKDNKYKKVVYKEYSNEILTGTVYTDLNGLSGNNPNGIIQTEFYKELAIIKRRFSLKNPLYSTNRINFNVKRKRDFNYGILSYATPHFVISKIESTNKYLVLSNKEVIYNGVTDTIFYASTMDLRKYESFRIGLKANVLMFDFPTAKTTFFIDYKFYWGRIPVKKSNDESAKIFQANSIEHGPLISVEFFTDERYGLRISTGYNWYYALNENYTQVGDDRTFGVNNEYKDPTVGKTGYWNARFLAYLKPARDGKGKIFFRYNYLAPADHGDLSWSQIQLGYAFSLTKTEKPEIPKEK